MIKIEMDQGCGCCGGYLYITCDDLNCKHSEKGKCSNSMNGDLVFNFENGIFECSEKEPKFINGVCNHTWISESREDPFVCKYCGEIKQR